MGAAVPRTSVVTSIPTALPFLDVAINSTCWAAEAGTSAGPHRRVCVLARLVDVASGGIRISISAHRADHLEPDRPVRMERPGNMQGHRALEIDKRSRLRLLACLA